MWEGEAQVGKIGVQTTSIDRKPVYQNNTCRYTNKDIEKYHVRSANEIHLPPLHLK